MLLAPDDCEALTFNESQSFSRWDPASGKDILGVPQLQRTAERFASSAVEVVSTGNEVLSVIQGEVAACQPGDGPRALGSDSATTCHIVGFRNPVSGRTCLAHLDSASRVSESVGCMLGLVSAGPDDRAGPAPPALADSLDVYIVGGYLGEDLAEDLSSALLSELYASRVAFRVALACMARLNSKRSRAAVDATVDDAPVGVGVGVKTEENVETNPEILHGSGWLPRRTGLSIELASGRPFPVRFEGAGRGPGWEVRHARVFAGAREEPLAEVYDARSDGIVVTPFQLWANPVRLTHTLALPDRELLAVTSTSPDAEHESFITDVRAQFAYMLDQIGPDGMGWWDNVFGGGRGRTIVYPRYCEI